MKRAEILEAARKCVCGDREEDYGTPERSFERIARLWSVYLGIDISAKDATVMMVLFKVARLKHSDKLDTYIDLAGYAACAGEIATERRPDIPDETANPAELVAVHNDTAVEMVTMRDLVTQKFPHYIDVTFFGSVRSCPYYYGFEENRPKFCRGGDSDDCNKCWSRLVPADTKIYDFMIGEQNEDNA